MKNLTEKLQAVGLSKNEALTYCHLLRLGTVSIGALVQATSLKKQSLYNALLLLVGKGLVIQEKTKGKARVFTPHSPLTLFEHHARQRQQLQNLLPELEMLKGSGQVVGDVQIVRGVTAFQTFLGKQLSGERPGFCVDVLGAGGDAFLAVTNKRAFFTRYENIRLQRKLSHRLLMYADQRQTNPAYTKRRYVEARYLPQNLSHMPLPVIIWSNSVSLLLFNEEPQIVHLTSKHIRDGYSAHFRALWEMASS